MEKLDSPTLHAQPQSSYTPPPFSNDNELTPEQKKSWWYGIRPENALLRGKSYLRAKRLFDISLIIITSPILFFALTICALLIKIESPGGPILFRQKRTGQNGRRFVMYKFRTMVPNAEEIKKQLAAKNELRWPDFKIKKDPRITRIGRILRRTSLDELPQVFNILKGDMSFVGPRPTSFRPDTYQPWQRARLNAQPGLTGLWQIIGRGEMEFEERSRLDIAYIERQCFLLDLLILLKTLTAVLRQKGAV